MKYFHSDEILTFASTYRIMRLKQRYPFQAKLICDKTINDPNIQSLSWLTAVEVYT